MDVSGYKRKFKLLFDKILTDNFEISDYHSENLLKFLDGSHNTSPKILETPFLADLIIYALKNFDFASTSVKVFIVKLLSIILRNEVHFNRFHQMHGFDLILSTSKEAYRDMPPELHLAYSRFALALTTHYSGVKFVMEQKLYKEILCPVTHHRPPAIARGVYDSISQLVWKLNEYDEETALLEALQYIVQPIVTCDWPATVGLGAECGNTISDQLITNLHTLVAILGEVERVIEPNNVVAILSRFFVIESKLSLILEQTPDAALAGLLAEVCLRYYFALSRQVEQRDRASEGRINEEFNMAFTKILYILVKKGSVPVILDFICKVHMFWHRVEAVAPPATFERFGRQYQLHSSFLVMLMVPIFVKQKNTQRLVDDRELEESMDAFTYGLAAVLPHDIIKAAYSIRDLIVKGDMLVSASVWSVRELRRLRGQLSRQQAGTVFQVLYYTLRGYVLSDGAGALVLVDNPLRTPRDAELLAAVLGAIGMLLDEHDIAWHESLEIVNLQAALLNLIKQDILPIELTIQAVDLITVSVRRLLSPELALALESSRGGSLREVGGAARALIAHADWQARVAALRLLLALTEVAYVKFVPLRKVIVEHGLMAAAACAALGDPAARAQASALRCLAAATQCECVWKELLTHYDSLYEQLVYMLRCHPHGEIRKEAANVLTHVYINHKVTKTFTTCVGRVMTRAALEDTHSEVKIAAINFWRQVARNQFTERGMLDGVFPTVTFSKEKRKIITLNEKEIQNRLDCIMGYLSSSGCLTVLLKCMNPYNDLEVIEKVYLLTSKLVTSLESYKYIPSNEVSNSPKNAKRSADVEMKSLPSSSRTVIDSNKPTQTDLIAEIFECFSSDSPRDETRTPVEIIRPKEFLDTFKSTDYKGMIESMKRTLVADLDTIIDDLISPKNGLYSPTCNSKQQKLF